MDVQFKFQSCLGYDPKSDKFLRITTVRMFWDDYHCILGESVQSPKDDDNRMLGQKYAVKNGLRKYIRGVLNLNLSQRMIRKSIWTAFFNSSIKARALIGIKK